MFEPFPVLNQAGVLPQADSVLVGELVPIPKRLLVLSQKKLVASPLNVPLPEEY